MTSHKDFLGKPAPDIYHVRDQLTQDEVMILRKYGAWLCALADGRLAPTTAQQNHFISAANGLVAPESDYEKTWLKWRDLRKRPFRSIPLLEHAKMIVSMLKAFLGELATRIPTSSLTVRFPTRDKAP